MTRMDEAQCRGVDVDRMQLATRRRAAFIYISYINLHGHCVGVGCIRRLDQANAHLIQQRMSQDLSGRGALGEAYTVLRAL
jgi:hypothetical protein